MHKGFFIFINTTFSFRIIKTHNRLQVFICPKIHLRYIYGIVFFGLYAIYYSLCGTNTNDLTEFFSKVHIRLSGWPESVPNGDAPMGITGNNNL